MNNLIKIGYEYHYDYIIINDHLWKLLFYISDKFIWLDKHHSETSDQLS